MYAISLVWTGIIAPLDAVTLLATCLLHPIVRTPNRLGPGEMWSLQLPMSLVQGLLVPGTRSSGLY